MIQFVTNDQTIASIFTLPCSGFQLNWRILPDPQTIATAMLFGRSNKLLCQIDRNSRTPVRNAGYRLADKGLGRGIFIGGSFSPSVKSLVRADFESRRSPLRWFFRSLPVNVA